MSNKAYETSTYALNKLTEETNLSDEEFEKYSRAITECHKATFGLTKTLLDFYNEKHLFDRQETISQLADFVSQLSKK